MGYSTLGHGGTRRDTNSGTPNLGHKIWNTQFGTKNLGHKIWHAKWETRGTLGLEGTRWDTARWDTTGHTGHNGENGTKRDTTP